jgi:hypothetical protein
MGQLEIKVRYAYCPCGAQRVLSGQPGETVTIQGTCTCGRKYNLDTTFPA